MLLDVGHHNTTWARLPPPDGAYDPEDLLVDGLRHHHGDLGEMALARIQHVDGRPTGQLAGDTGPGDGVLGVDQHASGLGTADFGPA